MTTEHRTKRYAHGNQPVLFVCVGDNAVGTIRELLKVTQELRVRVLGPFGLAILDQYSSEISISDSLWLSEMSIHATDTVKDARRRLSNNDDNTLATSLSLLARRLRTSIENTAFAESQLVGIKCYLLIDLSVAGTPESAIRIARLLRKADRSLDMTGLLLTGRSAESQDDTDDVWFESFTKLLTHLKEENLIQRLYILDGCDTTKHWLATLRQMHRIGAEFLLHHGLSPYRDHLHRKEQNRLSLKDSVLESCGAISCTTLRCDRLIMAQGVAGELVSDLADMEQRSLLKSCCEELDRLARTVAAGIVYPYKDYDSRSKKITSLSNEGFKSQLAGEFITTNVQACEDSDGTHFDTTSSDESRSSSEQVDDPAQQALNDIGKALHQVCAEKPIPSLSYFLKALYTALRESIKTNRLYERWAKRYKALEILQNQEKRTYQPIRKWLEIPEVKWPDRYKPFLSNGPPAAVNRPISWKYYLSGLIVMALGLLTALLSTTIGSAWCLLGGELVAIWGSVLTILPTKWWEIRRKVVPYGVHDVPTVPCSYRIQLGHNKKWQTITAGVLVFLMLTVGLVWTWWAIAAPTGRISSYPELVAIITLVVFLVVLIIMCFCTSRDRNSAPAPVPDEEEMPGHILPPDWKWHIIGLICLTFAWVLLNWHTWNLPSAHINEKLPGFALIFLGVIIARWPRIGETSLLFKTPKEPEPLPTETAKPVCQIELPSHIQNIYSCLQALGTEKQPAKTNSFEWPNARSHGSILEAIEKGWRVRLADAFRHSLTLQSEKSLEEMANNPQHWVDCIVKELDSPTIGLGNLPLLFTLHQVDRWQNSMTWEQLISKLSPDPQWAEFFLTRCVAPHWPPTRENPTIDTSVIVGGEEVWKILGPLAGSITNHQLMKAEWLDPHTMMVGRIVQGLGNGWLGYSALPGQKIQ